VTGEQVPGLVMRLAQSTFRRLPRQLRIGLVRTLSPSHTLGALCFIEHDGHILVLRQRHRRGWTLPGGLTAKGETAAQTAVREVAEETGLRVEVRQPFAVVVEPSTRRIDILFHVPLDHRPEVRASGEALQGQWLRPEDCGEVDVATRQAFSAYAGIGDPGLHRGRLLG
jgi:ADP-ribose pyrophosphatase YjhB (NUDIX family)